MLNKYERMHKNRRKRRPEEKRDVTDICFLSARISTVIDWKGCFCTGSTSVSIQMQRWSQTQMGVTKGITVQWVNIVNRFLSS